MWLSLIQDAPEGGALDRIIDWFRAHGPNLIWALAVLFAGWWIARLVTAFLNRLLNRHRVDPTLSGFLCTIAYLAMMIMVVISAIGRLGVPTTSFVAILGAAGLAVGLALQGSLGNFAAGVLIILFRPFRAGDVIEVAGVAGSVEEVQIFATTLRTADNKRIIVPNAAITGGNIVNISALPTRRVDLEFGISYRDDIEKAKGILERLAAEDARVLKDPATVVAVSRLADSCVNLILRPWVKTEHYWDVYWSLTERVKLEFDAQGISIPFPQRDLHLHQVA